MAYCRFVTDYSDVYVFHNITGFFNVHLTREKPYNELNFYTFKTRIGLLVFLNMLVEEGYKVPGGALERLQREIQEENEKEI